MSEFHDFLNVQGRRAPTNKAKLINYSKTIPVSSAECERGFSQMNLVATNLRNKLLVENISSLMFIKLTCPPLKNWNPSPYVITWLRKHRSADDQRVKKSLDESENKQVWKFFD